MTKNLYYRDTFGRENMFKVFFLSLFSMFTSYPRLLLEVFTRKDFGERYFRLSSAITLVVILGLLPYGIKQMAASWGGGEMAVENYSYDEGYGDVAQQAQNVQPMTESGLMPAYIGWYVFLAAFLLISIKHYMDNRRSPSAFNFKRFTLSSGVVHPVISNIKIPGLESNIRFIECYLEPALFFGAGILLALIGQTLGWLLMVCAFFYCMSYLAAYRSGDNFIMDKIDEIICNESLEKAFVDDGSLVDTRGFQFRGSKPQDTQLRRKILPLMTGEDDILAAE